MRTNVVLGALFLSLVGLGAGAANAQSTGTEKTTGGVKASNAGTSKAKTATTPFDVLNPDAPDPERCVVEKDSYERLLKGMAAEARALDTYRRERAQSSTKFQYDRCVMAFVQSPEFIQVMGGNLSNSAQMAKNAKKAEQATEKKCGEDPSKKWTKDKIKSWLDIAEFNGAQAANMSQRCYALFKEVAMFFCNLDKEAQDYAVENGIELAGKGSAKWRFSKEHAKLIAPKCIDLQLGLDAVERTTKDQR